MFSSKKIRRRYVVWVEFTDDPRYKLARDLADLVAERMQTRGLTAWTQCIELHEIERNAGSSDEVVQVTAE